MVVLAGQGACGSMPVANAKGLTISDSPRAVTAAAAAGSALGLPDSSAGQTAAMIMTSRVVAVKPCMSQCITCHLLGKHPSLLIKHGTEALPAQQ